jgi:hypothetical protein
MLLLSWHWRHASLLLLLLAQRRHTWSRDLSRDPLRRCSGRVGEIRARRAARRNGTDNVLHGVWTLDSRRDRVQLHSVPNVVLRWYRRRGASLVVVGDWRRDPISLLVVHRHWWSDALGYDRLSREPWTLVMVVFWYRRSWLWRTGPRGVYALRRSSAVSGLLYGGRASWSCCCGCCRGGCGCDGDNVACPSVTVCLSTNILATRTTLESMCWRGEAVVRLAVWRSGVCLGWLTVLRRLGICRGMVVLFARYRTRLVVKAGIHTAAFTAEVSRVGVFARSFLFFLFVSVVETVLRRLLFGGMEGVGHAPFAPLLSLGRRHVLGARHWLRRIGCGLTTQAASHLL